MYTYNWKKEMMKNIIYSAFILLFAGVSTYFIYNRFQDECNIDGSSESLVVVYHEPVGNQLAIEKVTPVTDSVGLSSKSCVVSIDNNLTEKVAYQVRISLDDEAILEDGCEDNLIPEEDIRISVKVNKNENKIYTLSELEDGILLDHKVKALGNDHISIRVWVRQDSALPRGADYHFHGVVQVIEIGAESVLDG